MNTQETYAGKIASLLAKAEATDNEHEAHAYYAKAAALMAQHNIDEALIEAKRDGFDASLPLKKDLWFEGSYALVRLNGAYWIAKAMFGDNVKATRSPRKYVDTRLSQSGKGGWRLSVLGFKNDLDAISTMYNSIDLQAASSLRRWTRETSYDAASSSRRSYLMGYFTGVSNKIEEAQRQVVEQVSSEGALVLASRAHKVQEMYDAVEKTAKPSRLYPSTDDRAFYRGVEDGKSASIKQEEIRA